MTELHISLENRGSTGYPALPYVSRNADVRRILRYCILALGLAMLYGSAGAAPAAPVAGFHADSLTGPAPLVVRFFDDSTQSPTGWAWYFGDEDFTDAWTLLNESAAWEPRTDPSVVLMPTGSMVLAGGGAGHSLNDTWRSDDYGNVWSPVNLSSGWLSRRGHGMVVMPDRSIVLAGGRYSADQYLNDTWRSTDNGATWNLMNASSGWPARWHHSMVALPDGSLLLMGGSEEYPYIWHDIWKSTDNGATWDLVTDTPGWYRRGGPKTVVMPDNSIVLTGGDNDNETWRSTDSGATWNLMNTSSGWIPRAGHGMVAMPDGSIVLAGGESYTQGGVNDTWRSTDSGATWTLVNASPGWTARFGMATLVVKDGSMLLAGGTDTDGNKNDVWVFRPRGSTLRYPEHTYTTPGLYTVALTARNAGGYNTSRKVGYIRVTGAGTMTGVFRPSTHRFILSNGTERTVVNWGLSTDMPVTGDWNRDALHDVGVFRPSTHRFILSNGTEKTVVNWGLSADIPVTGDWNRDALHDVGVFRPSTHRFILSNGTEKTVVNWGLSADIPVTGDWNGDGFSDVGVFRPSTHCFILSNGTERTVVNWGLSTDMPVTGDWNGDGLYDIGIYRQSIQKFILSNGTERTVVPWGLSTDIPVTGAWS